MEQVTNLIVTKSLIGQAQELASEHELFNDQYVVNGRKALNALLEKIFSLAQQFESSPDKEDLYRVLKTDLAQKYNIRAQANSSNISMLVRYITRAERKTAHVYARAIESALAKKIPSLTFEQYVEMSGGLEKIRIDGVDTSVKSPKQLVDEEKMNLSRRYLEARIEMPFETFKAPKQFDGMTNPNCGFELVICKWAGDEYRVVGKLAPTMENEYLMLREFSTFLFGDGNSIEKVRDAVERFCEKAEEKKQLRLNPPQQDAENLQVVEAALAA